MRSFLFVLAFLAFSNHSNAQGLSQECSDYVVFATAVDDLLCGFGTPVDPAQISFIEKNGDLLGDMKARGRGFQSIGSFLNDVLFKEKESISDGIFDAIGDWSVDINFLNKEFDFNDGDDHAVLDLPIELHPTTLVFLNNVGKTVGGVPDENFASRFTKMSGLTLRLRPSAEADIGSFHGSLRLFEAGASLKLIQQVDSPSMIVPRDRDSDDTADPAASVNAFMNAEQRKQLSNAVNSDRSKPQKFFLALGRGISKMFRGLSSGVGYVIKKFANSDKSKIIAEDPISSLSQLPQYFQVDAESVTRGGKNLLDYDVSAANVDGTLRVGDILSVIYYVNYGFAGGAGYEQAKVERKNDNVRIAVERSIKKEKDGFWKLRYQVSRVEGDAFGAGLEERISIGFASTRYRPIWYEQQDFGNGDSTQTQRITYRIDMNDTLARAAFDDVFRGILPDWTNKSCKDPDSDDCPPSNWQRAFDAGLITTVDASTTQALGGEPNNHRSRFKIETGLFKFKRQTSVTQTLRNEYDETLVGRLEDLDEESLKGSTLEGYASKNTRTRRRLIFEEDKESNYTFQSEIGLDENGQSTEVVLNFKTLFNDEEMTKKEHKYYQQVIQLSTGNGSIIAPVDKVDYDEYFEDGAPQGSLRFTTLNVSLYKPFTDAIFRRNVGDLTLVLSDLLTDGTAPWVDRQSIVDWRKSTRRSSCPVYSVIVDGGILDNDESISGALDNVRCSRIAKIALEYVDFFSQIKNASATDRSTKFTEFVKKNGYRTADILYVMIHLGRMDDQIALTDFFDSWIDYRLEIEDQVARTVLQEGTVFKFHKTEDEFNNYLSEAAAVKRIRKASVYRYDGRSFLIFDTQYKLPEGGLVKGIFYRFRKIWADVALGWSISENPAYEFIQGRNSEDIHRYAVELPQDLLAQLPQRDDINLQFWVEDSSHSRDTETADVKFSQK